MEKNRDNIDDLCPAGKVLEAHLQLSADNLLRATESLQTTCKEVSGTLQQLTEYAIRDKERIDNLEESRKCKNEKIKGLQQENHDMDVTLAKHLGEHEIMKRQEGNVGRKWGFLSGGGFVGFVELFKHLAK